MRLVLQEFILPVVLLQAQVTSQTTVSDGSSGVNSGRLVGMKCKELHDGCSICTGDLSECVQCASGFYLIDGRCRPPTCADLYRNCETCSEDHHSCVSCIDKEFTIVDGQCSLRITFDGFCKGEYNCEIEDGYRGLHWGANTLVFNAGSNGQPQFCVSGNYVLTSLNGDAPITFSSTGFVFSVSSFYIASWSSATLWISVTGYREDVLIHKREIEVKSILNMPSEEPLFVSFEDFHNVDEVSIQVLGRGDYLLIDDITLY